MSGPIQFEQPLPATHLESNTPCLVHGVVESNALVQWDDGRLGWMRLDSINIDFRFDYRRGAWINTSLIGGEDGLDEEDDWSPGVQGTVPDVDRERDGDQGDEADHDSGDVDAGEDAP